MAPKKQVNSLGENPTRDEVLKAILDSLEKNIGQGAATTLDGSITQKVDVIPTGIISLDIGLGVGGIPRGRTTELYGMEGSSKTTVASKIIASAQNMGFVPTYIDAEQAFDKDWGTKNGIDYKYMTFSQPKSGEEAINTVMESINTGGKYVGLVCVDSIDALLPEDVIHSKAGEHPIGAQARLISDFLRKITPVIAKHNIALLLVNQLRESISTMPGIRPSRTTSGGRAIKFYSSTRIEVVRIGRIGQTPNIVGTKHKFTITKNKVAAPYQTGEFELYFKYGIPREGSIIDSGLEYGIITKAGAYYSYNDTRIGYGKDTVIQILREDKDLADEIYNKILEVAKPSYDEIVEDENDEIEEEDDAEVSTI